MPPITAGSLTRFPPIQQASTASAGLSEITFWGKLREELSAWIASSH